MNCPKCGNVLSDSAKFCGKCGTSIELAQETQATPCIHCGKSLKPGAKFCGHCGNSQAAVPAPTPAPQPEPVPVIQPVAQPQVAKPEQPVSPTPSYEQPTRQSPIANQESSVKKIVLGGVGFVITAAVLGGCWWFYSQHEKEQAAIPATTGQMAPQAPQAQDQATAEAAKPQAPSEPQPNSAIPAQSNVAPVPEPQAKPEPVQPQSPVDSAQRKKDLEKLRKANRTLDDLLK